MGLNERKISAMRAFGAQIAATIRQLFDPAYYAATTPGTAEADGDLLQHYLRAGPDGPGDPSPRFSTYYYVHRHPEVRRSGKHPLLHYALHGKRLGLATLPDGVKDAGAFRELREVLEEGFDRDWYLQRNPDVAESGVCPLIHFIEVGSRERRDPAPEFNTAFYLKNNPDVAGAAINPFYHYLRQGRAEGRHATPPPSARVIERLRKLRPIEEAARDWRRRGRSPAAMDSDELLRLLSAEVDGRGMIVALTHDDHSKVIGGVQLCVSHEAEAAAREGLAYLAVHPWQPLPCLAEADSDPLLVLRLDGKPVGAAPGSTVARALARWSSPRRRHRKGRFALAVHALLGHTTEFAAELARHAAQGQSFFWLHDYFSICPSLNLLRNGLTYCGAPEPSSAACGICAFGGLRPAHMGRMRALFEAAPLSVVSPSEVTLEIWQARSGLTAGSSHVVPHCTLDRLSKPPRRPKIGKDAPVRVAFAGFPVDHKGWPVFETLLNRERRNRDYHFQVFSAEPVDDPAVETVPVRVTPGDPGAMTRALATHGAELAVMWASGPETFSLAAHEALAAGTAVICPERAGNIARLVSDTGDGLVLPDETGLFEAFASGDVAAFARERRSKAGPVRRLAFGDFTAGLVDLG